MPRHRASRRLSSARAVTRWPLTGLGAAVILTITLAACETAAPERSSASLAVGSPSPTATATVVLTRDQLAEAVRFRRTFGLRADEFWIRKVAADPGADWLAFGTPLSSEELDDLERRNGAGFETMKQAVIAYGMAHKGEWAGAFTDQARGGILVIQFSGHLDQHRAALASTLQPDAKVEFRAVRWSLGELEAQAQRLRGTDSWFRTIPAVLQSYGVDITTDRIKVRISSVDPLAAGMIEDHFGLSGMIDVESDDTGAMLVPTGMLRVFARDGAGHPVRGLRCEARPDIGDAVDGGGTETDRAGRCRLKLPATGTWVLLIQGSGPTRTVVGIGRAVVTPEQESDLVIEVTVSHSG